MGGGRKEESRAAGFYDLHITNTKMNEERVLGQCDATFSGPSAVAEPCLKGDVKDRDFSTPICCTRIELIQPDL